LKYDWINEYCLSKSGVQKDFKVEWQWHRYLIEKKLFCAVCTDKGGRPIVTLKCEPSFGTMLRSTYEDIVPGYYMNKEHWNSVYLDADVPDNIIKQMIDMSYSLVFSSLPKKVQRSIG